MIPSDRPFKSDCRFWRGDRPCDVQRTSGSPDCRGCPAYTALTAPDVVRLTPPYDPERLLRARSVCIAEAGGLGSVLRTTAVSRAIRQVNPRADLRWLTSDRGRELLRLVPGVTPVDCELDLVAERIARSADVVVNFDTGRLGRVVAAAGTMVAGLQLNEFGHFEAAAHAGLLQRLQIDDRFRASRSPSMQSVLVRTLGLPGVPATYDLALPAAVRLAGRSSIAAWFGRRPQTVVGLTIGSSRRGRLKRWPPRRWAELTSRLVRRSPGLGIVVLSGPEERPARSAFTHALDGFAVSAADRRRLVVAPGDQSVADHLGLVSALDLVVTGDTFGLHAAAALQVPLVALVGPMPHRELELAPDDRVVGPTLDCAPCFYRCHQPVRGACMRALGVGEVLEAILGRLDVIARLREAG